MTLPIMLQKFFTCPNLLILSQSLSLSLCLSLSLFLNKSTRTTFFCDTLRCAPLTTLYLNHVNRLNRMEHRLILVWLNNIIAITITIGDSWVVFIFLIDYDWQLLVHTIVNFLQVLILLLLKGHQFGLFVDLVQILRDMVTLRVKDATLELARGGEILVWVSL